MRGLIWFREDLRLRDNLALSHAANACDEGLVACYLLDEGLWRAHDTAACRVEFILRGLKQLSQDLQSLNIPLVLIKINESQETAAQLYKLLKQLNATSLFYNRQYEINEARRDQAVLNFLKQHEITCHSFDDQVIFTPLSVTTQEGSFFKVFTAFKHAWYKKFLARNTITLLKIPKKQMPLPIESTPIPDRLPGFQSNIDPALWPSGETSATQRLETFIEENLFTYDSARDFPAISGTSQLSPYLATGMISPRVCFMAALMANHNELETGNKGAVTWMNELIWREFYKHLLVATPRVCMHRAYQQHTEKLKWRFDEKQLLAWQQGRTGFPIIDAAMRQLNQTGWMHNRLRMIVGMFFTKNLFFDWRLGEKYFMQHLIDGDLAANNGGWQWCASTGTDAAPYFRIFNPLSQSEKFDPEGEFIRTFCPELKSLDNKSIHAPHTYAPLLASQMDYPLPIVDLKVSRAEAIAAFKQLRA